MANTKRAVLLLGRWCTVIVAVGFLTVYVWRAVSARREKMLMFASSKNARVLSLAADQYFLERGPGHPSAASVVSRAKEEASEPSLPFTVTIQSHPMMLGGSKSGIIAFNDFVRWPGNPPSALPANFDLRTLLFSIPSPSHLFYPAPPVRLEPGEGEAEASLSILPDPAPPPAAP